MPSRLAPPEGYSRWTLGRHEVMAWIPVEEAIRMVLDDFYGRKIGHRCHEVFGKRRGRLLTVLVVLELLETGVADPECHATMDLTTHDHGIDRRPRIVDGDVTLDLESPGVGKHFDHDGMDIAALHPARVGFEVGGMLESAFHALG